MTVTPEVKAWLAEIRSYVQVGRALDGKDLLPDEQEEGPTIDKSAIMLLIGCGLFILLMTVILILQAVS